MSTGRHALLIATGSYDKPALKKLRSPARDAKGLGQVLQDRQIGGFDVRTVLDGRHSQVARSIEEFFLDRRPDDLLLVHLSCHGIKNDNGELYFAAKDTDPRLLDSTAVSAAFLHTQMVRCRAKSIVILLDCCYSGAFWPGAKGDDMVHIRDELGGHGRVVITATNRTEYAWEGDSLTEADPAPSRFTAAIIEGLRTGRADRDRDGLISIHELYDYVCQHLRVSDSKQRPQLWAMTEYRVVVARSVLRPRQEELLTPPLPTAAPEADGDGAEVDLAADRITISKSSSGDSEFVQELIVLLRQQELPYAKLRELAPSEKQLNGILKGRFPSRRFTINLVEHLAPEDLPEWEVRWEEANAQRSRSAEARPRKQVDVPLYRPPAPKPSFAFRVWMPISAALAPALTYGVTATFTAGLQAEPGAGIRNLVVYAVVGLVAVAIVDLFLVVPTVEHRENLFFIAAALTVLAFAAGLVVPWVWDVSDEPWYSIADRVGLI